MPVFLKHYNLYFEHLPRNSQNEVSQETMGIIKNLNFPIGLFYDFYADIPSKDALQISVYMTRERKRHNLMREFFGNIVIYIFFDEQEFLSIKEKEKQKEYILSSFEAALYRVADIYSMPKENLKKAHDIILASKYVFQTRITEEIMSPDEKTKAYIFARHDSEKTNKIIYYSVFEDAEKKYPAKEIMFANTTTEKETMENMIKNTSWIDNESLKVSLGNGKDYFTIFLKTSAVEFFLKEAMASNARAQFNLAKMYYRGETVMKSQKDYFFWLKKAAGNGLPQAIEALKEN